MLTFCHTVALNYTLLVFMNSIFINQYVIVGSRLNLAQPNGINEATFSYTYHKSANPWPTSSHMDICLLV